MLNIYKNDPITYTVLFLATFVMGFLNPFIWIIVMFILYLLEAGTRHTWRFSKFPAEQKLKFYTIIIATVIGGIINFLVIPS